MDRPSAIYESEKQLKALADVLEGKEYKNTGATRGQSKWLKYIAELTERNQVFGPKVVETEIMPEQTFTFVDSEGEAFTEGLATLNANSIIPEEIYNVKFDGVLYKTKGKEYRGNGALGNLALANNDPSYNTNEPFFIMLFFDGENSGIGGTTTLGVGDHTISISKTETIIKKIPKEYLPDDIGGGSSVQSDWNQTDASASDYIKNKPTISEQVQADWNQTNTSSKSYIKNKPSLVGKLILSATGTGQGEIFNEYAKNKANGTYSHAEGFGTTASGDYSHAEGSGTVSSGGYSHAEGSGTKAIGFGSHAEGLGTTANSYQSHAEGSNTTASGGCSHAEGGDTTASGSHSHAEGNGVKASSSSQHAQGKYNIEDANNVYAHIVGNGKSDTTRSNAHTLDWSGNAWFAGTVEGTAMIVISSTEGSSKRFKITVDDTGAIKATEITA